MQLVKFTIFLCFKLLFLSIFIEFTSDILFKSIFCSCSICLVKHNLHFVVPEEHFKLISGSKSLTTYTFNTHVAKHMFCKVCGVQSFYKPRSNPDGYGKSFEFLSVGYGYEIYRSGVKLSTAVDTRRYSIL